MLLTVAVRTFISHFTVYLSNIIIAGGRPNSQRLVYNGRQCGNDQTMGEVAASCKTPLGRFEPTFDLVMSLRGGMFHSSSGRQDQENLSEDELDSTKVCL
jgi:hypothetical protein